jgi:hypothetical protein
MTDGDHRAIHELALEVARRGARDGGALGLGIGGAAADDRIGQAEGSDQPYFEVEIDIDWSLDVDLHDSRLARPDEEALDLGARQSELVGDFGLGPIVEVPAVRDAGEQLAFVPAAVDDHPRLRPRANEQLLTCAQMLTHRTPPNGACHVLARRNLWRRGAASRDVGYPCGASGSRRRHAAA